MILLSSFAVAQQVKTNPPESNETRFQSQLEPAATI